MVAGYKELLNRYPDKPIFVLVESGGAYMTLTTTLLAMKHNLRLPNAVALYSTPCAWDYSLSSPGSKHCGGSNPFLFQKTYVIAYLLIYLTKKGLPLWMIKSSSATVPFFFILNPLSRIHTPSNLYRPSLCIPSFSMWNFLCIPICIPEFYFSCIFLGILQNTLYLP